MKSIFKRIIVLALVLCTLMSMTLPVFAASKESASVTSASVNTSGGKYYVAFGYNVAVKKKASASSQTDCKLQPGSLIKVTGASGQYYKIDMNGTRYVKKSSVRQATGKVAGEIYYTTKNCPLRPQPYEGATTENLTKGTAVVVVGKLVNSKGNQWLLVAHNGAIRYIYSKNVARASKVTLKVSGSTHTVDTRGTLQLTATVSPSGIKNIKWTSSNDKVATVSDKGLVTGVSNGAATITASINGVISAKWDVTVTRNVELDVKAYRQTTNYTCSAASTLAVLRYYGKETNTKDTTLYKSINGTVGNITKALNQRLNGMYKYATFKSVNSYEEAIYNSLAQGSPVIARVRFPKKYFNYSSNGHYTTIIGMYKDDSGRTWLKLVDSFADRYKSNSYTDKNTAVVNVPLEELYKYGTYGGSSAIYLIYNPK